MWKSKWNTMSIVALWVLTLLLGFVCMFAAFAASGSSRIFGRLLIFGGILVPLAYAIAMTFQWLNPEETQEPQETERPEKADQEPGTGQFVLVVIGLGVVWLVLALALG